MQRGFRHGIQPQICFRQRRASLQVAFDLACADLRLDADRHYLRSCLASLVLEIAAEGEIDAARDQVPVGATLPPRASLRAAGAPAVGVAEAGRTSRPLLCGGADL